MKYMQSRSVAKCINDIFGFKIASSKKGRVVHTGGGEKWFVFLKGKSRHDCDMWYYNVLWGFEDSLKFVEIINFYNKHKRTP